jgi:UPF0755 protein
MRLFLKFVLFCIVLGAGVLYMSLPPKNAPDIYTLSVEHGDTLHIVADKLYLAHVIQSKTLFILYARVLGNERSIISGEYVFKKPAPSYSYALHIVDGIFGIQRTKIVIPEGSTNTQIVGIVTKNFSTISEADFLVAISSKEGYMFPDTYAFFPSVTKEDIISRIQENFNYKLGFFDTRIRRSGYSKLEILTMASLLEKEAYGDTDRDVISGILWKRLEKGMPLQVDASNMFDNRFDSYQTKGLPPAPIDNPGEKAIEAALHPTDSPYLYYLHDKTGHVHYAISFAEHKKNIQIYLK